MTRRLSSAAADQAWEDIVSGLVLTDEKIRRFIRAEGWIGKGFASFWELWRSDPRISQLSIAREIRPHIMYQMFEEGRSDEEIAIAIKGVGGEFVRSQRDRFNNCKPPSARVEPPRIVSTQRSEIRVCNIRFRSNREYRIAMQRAKDLDMTMSEYGRSLMLGEI